LDIGDKDCDNIKARRRHLPGWVDHSATNRNVVVAGSQTDDEE
jgi:hypothetical protein